MSELSIELHWQHSEASLHSVEYSKVHSVGYSDNYELQVDAAPDWGGDADTTSPEQTLSAAVSSCHMMTFLLQKSAKVQTGAG